MVSEINFGSRRGFVYTYWHRLLFHAGVYRRYRKVDWNSVERLIFVCKGNICRSAFAEAVARSQGIDAVSCGIDTIKNAPANETAILIAKQFAVDLGDHKTTPLSNLQFKETDLLITMEPWQAEFLQNKLNDKFQCTLLGLWSRRPLPYIQDPYGLSSSYFAKCFTEIQHAVNALVGKINQ